MIEFIKGNQDSLEGRVLIYSNLSLCDHPEHDQVHAMYGNTEASGLISRLLDFGFEENDISTRVNRIVIETSRLVDPLKHKVVYFVFFSVKSNEEIIENPKDDDLIFVGKFTDVSRCYSALDATAKLYSNVYTEQRSVRQELMKEPAKIRTHKDFAGEPIIDYVLNKYIVPMLDSMQRDDTNFYQRLNEELAQFSADSPFASATAEMSAIIKKSGRNPNVPLIEAYVKIIDAVHREDYMGAAAIRDKIKDLEIIELGLRV